MDKPRLVFVFYPLPRNPIREAPLIDSRCIRRSWMYPACCRTGTARKSFIADSYDTGPSLCRIKHICVAESAYKCYASEAVKIHLFPQGNQSLWYPASNPPDKMRLSSPCHCCFLPRGLLQQGFACLFIISKEVCSGVDERLKCIPFCQK